MLYSTRLSKIARPAARFSSASLIALCLAGTSLAGTAPSAPAAPPAAPLADLVAQVNIPFERFQLANGLTVIVHTDRKAPIVGVTTYYRVGSKNEPKGHTGFAHLYEHLFFGGSANAPSFDEPLEQAGATATNGSTSYDRTNYVETVPKGALDLALFLESDRMGHLLAAVTQDKLDKQRGVVENEKRQDDNQPYGLLSYALAEGLFPVGHPYRHTPLGSMADLDAATLGDVRAWFTQHYAPGNVVLVLTGDIDAATARPLVERYFGAIPAGPKVEPVAAGPVTLAAPRARAMTDRVATTTLYRAWSGPGVNDPDAEALEIGMTVLGGLASSRLDNALVRGRQLAVGVTASDEQNEQVSQLTASLSIKPGVPRAEAEAAFDAEIARFLAEGPTADELRRAATRTVAEEIGALEVIGGFGGKGAQLAEGQLYSGDPAHYRAELARIAALTPEAVRDAMRRWLGRPAYNLTVNPGERTEKGDAMGGWGDEAATPARPVDAKKPVPPIAAGAPRPQPAVAPVGALAFPAVEHARLSNGMAVDLARRTAVPKVLVSLGFDAGVAADAVDAPGTQGLLLAMLQEGTAGAHPRDATQVLEEQERLGATISAGASLDTSTVTLDALKANLAPSLGLLADVLRSPAFAAGDLARVKQQRLTALEQTLASPQGQAARALNPLLFGPGTPYGQPGDGLGSKASLAALDGPALRKAMGEWLRPDNARITIVGDITMAEALPLLERAFGDWAPPAAARPAKPDVAPPPPAPRIVVIDRPHSPQSVILGGRVLPLSGRDAVMEPLGVANDVLGGDFLSRLNTDLREEKGWSYGVSTTIRQPLGRASLIVYAPVQTDRTGDAIKALVADMKALPGRQPVAPAELARATDGTIRQLPARFETNGQVLGAVSTNQRYGRPDDYYVTLPQRLRGVDAKQADALAARYLQPDGLVFVVVGEKAAIAPQLKDLGLPVEYVSGGAGE